MSNKPNYQLKELSGQKFGRLTVIERGPQYFAKSHPSGMSTWVCECSCQDKTRKIIRQRDLLKGAVNSCGCIKKEMLIAKNTTHGASRRNNQFPEYVVWRGIKQRCLGTDKRANHVYKDRGITMDESWLNFNKFLDDMGPRPSPYHTCDRIDGTLGYTKSNCRWATYEEQSNNRSTTIKITRNGITKSLKEWCAELGINYTTIAARIYQHKWDAERALTTPIRKIDRREHLYVGRM